MSEAEWTVRRNRSSIPVRPTHLMRGKHSAAFAIDRDGLIECNVVGQTMLDRGNLVSGWIGQELLWRSPTLQAKFSGLVANRRPQTTLFAGKDVTGVQHVMLCVPEENFDPDLSRSDTYHIFTRDVVGWAEEQVRFPSHFFSFTAGEKALAESLIMGRGLEAHAATRGSVVSTVRKQLSSVFTKTSTNRQVELVATLLAAGALNIVGGPFG